MARLDRPDHLVRPLRRSSLRLVVNSSRRQSQVCRVRQARLPFQGLVSQAIVPCGQWRKKARADAFYVLSLAELLTSIMQMFWIVIIVNSLPLVGLSMVVCRLIW